MQQDHCVTENRYMFLKYIQEVLLHAFHMHMSRVYSSTYSRSLAYAVFSGAVFTSAQFKKDPKKFGIC